LFGECRPETRPETFSAGNLTSFFSGPPLSPFIIVLIGAGDAHSSFRSFLSRPFSLWPFFPGRASVLFGLVFSLPFPPPSFPHPSHVFWIMSLHRFFWRPTLAIWKGCGPAWTCFSPVLFSLCNPPCVSPPQVFCGRSIDLQGACTSFFSPHQGSPPLPLFFLFSILFSAESGVYVFPFYGGEPFASPPIFFFFLIFPPAPCRTERWLSVIPFLHLPPPLFYFFFTADKPPPFSLTKVNAHVGGASELENRLPFFPPETPYHSLQHFFSCSPFFSFTGRALFNHTPHNTKP